MSNTELDLEAERARFEAATPGLSHLRGKLGAYCSDVVHDHWQGWLLCAARRATIQPTADQPVGEVVGTDLGYRIQWRGAWPTIGMKLYTAPVAPADAVRDAERLDWLSAAVENGCVTSCFEMDGGVHLTLEGVGEEPEAYRNMDNLRAAIDAALKSIPREPAK